MEALSTTSLTGSSAGAYLAVVVAAVLVVVVVRICRPKRLPGRLQARGSFEHEDPASSDAIAERLRDFARIVATQRDLWIFTPSSGKAGTVLPVQLPARGNAAAEEASKVAYQKLKFWLQEELGKIPGAIDLGLTSQWSVVDRVVYFISVTPGFEFLMRHKVPPMISQAKYVLMVSTKGQVRVAWYAFATDKPAPGATSGPFVVKLVSEDLHADRGGGRTYSRFSYTAQLNRSTDMEQVIGRHAPLVMQAIQSDTWEPFLRA